jgi:Protein of unknown function (DUF4012)
VKVQIQYERGWSPKRVLTTVCLVVLFLSLALVIDFFVRIRPALQALQDGRDAVVSAETSAKLALNHADVASFAAVDADLRRARDDFTTRSSVIDNGWETAIVAHLPWLGDQMRAAQAMRQAGADGSQLGIDLLPVIEQVDPAIGSTGGGGILARLWAAASAHASAIGAAEGDLTSLDTAVAQIPSVGLVGQLEQVRSTILQKAATLSSTAHLALNFLAAAPSALGTTERRYLVLVNNPGEERPGGGFIGAVGEVDVEKGQILSEKFVDSGIFNGKVPAESAPRPLDTYLFHGVPWELSDANWDADFPISAAAVSRFYVEATGHKIDGVISLDPVAVSYLLQVVGPVQVPPYRQVITASNTLLEINYITNYARPGDPGKVFLPSFAKLLLDRLLKPANGELNALVSALGRGVQEKHVVLMFTDASLERVVEGINGGGQLLSSAHDGLLVADANLSGGKDDLFVGRHFALSATVTADGMVHDKLVLTYHNPVQSNPANLKLIVSLGNDYEDYIQVFVPSSASLDNIKLTADGSTSSVSAEDVTTEGSRAVFAYFLTVAKGKTVSLEFDYSGPFAALGGGYQLSWEKELNALSWPIAVDVQTAWHQSLHWASDLSIDRLFSIP